MKNSDLKKAFIIHEANRHISAALLAFSKAVDKAIQKGEKVSGRVYEVNLVRPSSPKVTQYIVEKMSTANGRFSRYTVKLGRVGMKIFSEILMEPSDLGKVARDNETQITDAIMQEKENNPTNIKDIPVEHIQLTKEDLE